MIFFFQLLAIHKLIKHVNQENTFYKSPLILTIPMRALLAPAQTLVRQIFKAMHITLRAKK